MCNSQITAVQEPLTITSFALSLLLVFRTNSSYGRFAEARKLWGLLLNRSRDIVRQARSETLPCCRRICFCCVCRHSFLLSAVSWQQAYVDWSNERVRFVLS